MRVPQVGVEKFPARSLQGSEERVFVLTGGAGRKQRPKEVTELTVSKTQRAGHEVQCAILPASPQVNGEL